MKTWHSADKFTEAWMTQSGGLVIRQRLAPRQYDSIELSLDEVNALMKFLVNRLKEATK